MKARVPTLLAHYHGRRPPAPYWFRDIAEPERHSVSVAGANIELLTWGEIGSPGLLFLHGNFAHAHWWGFIAPFFARTHRCAALSWSGMGGSEWRPLYSIEVYVQEALAAIEAAGLRNGNGAPVAIAHSFGGAPLLHLAAYHPTALSGLVLVDSFAQALGAGPGPKVSATNPRYESLATALAHFRLTPDQPCINPWAVDYLARHALILAPEDNHQPAGWTWRFDPQLWATLSRGDTETLCARCTVPAALLYGDREGARPLGHVHRTQAAFARCLIAEIAGAHHHVMVDQPLALVSAIRVVLAAFDEMDQGVAIR